MSAWLNCEDDDVYVLKNEDGVPFVTWLKIPEKPKYIWTCYLSKCQDKSVSLSFTKDCTPGWFARFFTAFFFGFRWTKVEFTKEQE